MTTWPELSGCRIQRIDSPADELFAITLGKRDLRVTLVVVLSGPQAGVGLCQQRPKGRAANAFVQRLRRKLDGARVEQVGASGPTTVRLCLTNRAGSWQLDFELSMGLGNVVVLDGQGQPIFGLRATPPGDGAEVTKVTKVTKRTRLAIPADMEALREAGPRLLAARDGDALQRARQPLHRAMGRRSKALARRLAAIEGDRARALDVPRLRAHAGLVLSNLHAIDDRATEATVVDHASGEAEEISLHFERGLGPKGSAEAWFKRARRLERGAAIAAQRHTATTGEIASLQKLIAELDEADSDDRIEDIRERARALGVDREASTPKKRGQPPTRKPYREYVGTGGHVILVGRGARDNDELTIKIARPHDLFVHARGTAGAHVIVRLARGMDCPSELLVDAATLAAHFSSMRGEAIVEVSHLARRHVRKPRGSASGSVTVQSEKVLQLRTDPERLARLLASHRA